MMKRGLLFFILLVLFVYCRETPLKKPDDYQHLFKILSTSTKKTPEDAHYSVAALFKLKGELGQHNINKESLCAILSPKISTIKDLYHTIAATAGLGCSSEEFKFEEKIKAHLDKISTSDSTENLFYLMRSIFLLRDKLKFTKESLNKVYDIILKRFNENTGLFNENIEETGLSYSILKILHTLLSSQKAFTDEKLTTYVKISGKANLVLQKFISEEQTLHSASVLASGLNQFSILVPLNKKVTKDDIMNLADVILKHKKVNSISQLYDFVEGLTSISKSSIYTPHYISEIFNDEKNFVFSVTISDIMGEVKPGSKLILERAYPTSDEDSTLVENIEFKQDSSDATKFVWDYSKNKNDFQSGVIKFEFVMKYPKEEKELKFERIIKFETSVLVQDFRISVQQLNERRDVIDSSSYIVKFGDQLTDKILVTKDNKLSISFALVDESKNQVEPHQVFLRFAHKKSGKESILVLKRSDERYKLDINIEKVAKDVFGNLNGVFQLYLIIGDEILKKPIQWNIGGITVELPTSQSSTEDDESVYYSIRPEIKHMFKPQAKRPPKTISRAVTIMIAAPLFFLFIGILVIGPNFKACPGGLDFLLNMIFHLCILGMLATIFMYWIQFTIFQAMGYLLILGVVATLIGTRALRGVHNQRSKH